ncbi:MAG TPA: AraC family transcriptional regulator, partial [Fibrella sp.]
MKKETSHPYLIESISDLHRLFALPKPAHPSVSVIDLSDIKCRVDDSIKSVMYSFYSICIKKDFMGKLKYG